MLDGSTHGGKGQGGSILFRPSDANSSIDISGDIFALADGFGGGWSGQAIPTNATGGDGRGGFANIQLSGGSFTVGDTLTLEADAFGGDGRDGGQARGGNVGLFGAGGSANLGPDIFMSANAHGGDAVAGNGGGGGHPQDGGGLLSTHRRLPQGGGTPPP